MLIEIKCHKMPSLNRSQIVEFCKIDGCLSIKREILKYHKFDIFWKNSIANIVSLFKKDLA
ncbi:MULTISPECIES: hypothetical protein [Campylobacter]|uniref:Uncharacterized protein n=1 Tax=Campylobacter porcelli TaxID=1660073 RepID=A0A1X9SYR4_9BACT|nr:MULTISPECIES: hypothetical protein [unclassified Campylobacter]MCR8678765.1 hypothetical protein [Campylobacter sp. RM19072]MCR8696274.1 hypothetical protein [Campylobacter sp. RM19073]MEE3705500.1 hypothetical protein [Campylobacter sp. CX2-8023-23]MEE3744213.1 hypothetical protein [Campylobacter sp. CX2-4855-23]MEE3777364.1 hypothetical protein [Campylobacter sp. CX2-4080-23]